MFRQQEIISKEELAHLQLLVPEGMLKLHEQREEIDKTWSSAVRMLRDNIVASHSMTNDEFWAFLDNLDRKHLKMGPKYYSVRTEGNVKKAMHNWYCDAIHTHFRKYERLVVFCDKYNKMVCDLNVRLSNHPGFEGLGDDSYGDAVDTFPLYGRELVELACCASLPAKPTNDQEGYGPKGEWYMGEMYIHSTLDQLLDRRAEVYLRDVAEAKKEREQYEAAEWWLHVLRIL